MLQGRKASKSAPFEERTIDIVRQSTYFRLSWKGSLTPVIDLKHMNSAETQVLQDLGAAWSSYGPALRAKFTLDGGMTWRRGVGGEFLYHYRVDAETGKKKWTALGIRSAETEAIHHHFISRRGDARQTVLDTRDDIKLAGRLVKAHGLAKMPGKHAEVLRSFWLRSLDDRMTLFGGHALLGYELSTITLAPASLVRDESLLFVVHNNPDDETIGDIKDAFQDAIGARVHIDQKRKRTVMKAGEVDIELLETGFFTKHLDSEEQVEVIEDSLNAPPVTGLTVARDSQPVELKVLDPRAYAIAAYALGGDEIWTERAQFAATLVRECWPEPFDPRQESAFPDLCLDPEETRPSRLYGP
jgi:hypothetical protein